MLNLNSELKLTHLPKTISGIDTLYYFYQTNSYYDDLFLDIIDQIEEKKSQLEKNNTMYKYSDITVRIADQELTFSGKDQGFYWLKHSDSLFRIAFKDPTKNKNLHNIQVQLNAKGIYTFGIKAIVKLIDDLLDGFITGLKPITRADLNIFVQDDFSWITKEMFVTRKRIYQTISKEIASKYGMQTLYIGKKPFLLRMYNKSIELERTDKYEMMWEHFLNNGFEIRKTVFNLEFEMHREHLLRVYGINTIDDLFQQADALFRDCMDALRLVDLSSITENEKNSNNKNRATTLPLWTHLKESYALENFLQLDLPIQRLKRKIRTYSETEAIKDFLAFNRRCDIDGVILDKQFYGKVQSELERLKKKAFKFSYRLIYKQYLAPYRFPRLEMLTDFELLEHLRFMESEMEEPFIAYDNAFKHLQDIRDEIEKREISEEIVF